MDNRNERWRKRRQGRRQRAKRAQTSRFTRLGHRCQWRLQQQKGAQDASRLEHQVCFHLLALYIITNIYLDYNTGQRRPSARSQGGRSVSLLLGETIGQGLPRYLLFLSCLKRFDRHEGAYRIASESAKLLLERHGSWAPYFLFPCRKCPLPSQTTRLGYPIYLQESNIRLQFHFNVGLLASREILRALKWTASRQRFLRFFKVVKLCAAYRYILFLVLLRFKADYCPEPGIWYGRARFVFSVSSVDEESGWTQWMKIES